MWEDGFGTFLVGAVALKDSGSSPLLRQGLCDGHSCHTEKKVYLDLLVFQPDVVDLASPMLPRGGLEASIICHKAALRSSVLF